MKNSSLRQRAFTLIELLIVITIIGILVVATLPRLFGGLPQARDAQRKADLSTIATALELWASEEGGGLYPNPAAAGNACIDSALAPATMDLTSYLTTIPEDPLSGNFFAAPCADAGYNYQATENGRGFILVARLENDNGEGPGIYVDEFTMASPTTTSSRTYLDNATNALCTSALANCKDLGAAYVVGR
jgi:general secretion pathway protein G